MCSCSNFPGGKAQSRDGPCFAEREQSFEIDIGYRRPLLSGVGKPE